MNLKTSVNTKQTVFSLHPDDETRRLQDEVEAARKVQEEATAAIIAASIPNHIHVRENDENDDLMMNGESMYQALCSNYNVVTASELIN